MSENVSKKSARLIIGINLAAAGLIIALAISESLRRTHAFDELMFAIGEQNEVDPRLISALIWKESRYDPLATGKAGERGLMQIMEPAAMEWVTAETIKNFNPDCLYDPKTNILAGTWYLAKALRDWSKKEDPLPYALAQYNAGRSNALRWERASETNQLAFIESITYPGTKQYVGDILKRYDGRH